MGGPGVGEDPRLLVDGVGHLAGRVGPQGGGPVVPDHAELAPEGVGDRLGQIAGRPLQGTPLLGHRPPRGEQVGGPSRCPGAVDDHRRPDRLGGRQLAPRPHSPHRAPLELDQVLSDADRQRGVGHVGVDVNRRLGQPAHRRVQGRLRRNGSQAKGVRMRRCHCMGVGTPDVGRHHGLVGPGLSGLLSAAVEGGPTNLRVEPDGHLPGERCPPQVPRHPRY